MADEPVDQQADPGLDRPVANLKGEFDRKFGQLAQKIDVITGYLANKEAEQAQPKPAEPAKGSLTSLTNDDLWERAKAGDKEAFDLHQKRMAAQTYREMKGVEDHQTLVDGQVAILHGKYPVLNNPQHELTQTVRAANALLLRRGYQPSNATYLEAVKTAIADRPDLVAEMHTQGARAREGARRVSAGNTGVTGATYRQDDPAQTQSKIRVTPEQSAIAKRMNIKDPGKAIENFIKRQETGESRFGAVASFVPQGEF